MDDVFRRPIGDPPATPDGTRSDDDGPASLAPARDYRSDPSGSVRGDGADVCILGSPQATAVVAQAPALWRIAAAKTYEASPQRPGKESARIARKDATERRSSSRRCHARRLEWRNPRQQPAAPLGGPREPVTRAEDASPPQGRVRKPPGPAMAAGVRFFAPPGAGGSSLKCHLAG